MVAPVIVAGGMALIRLIAWLSSAVLLSSYVRDIVTKQHESNIQTSQDSTIDNILNNDTLTDAQKEKLITDYVASNSGSSGSGDEDLKKYALLGFAGLAALTILGRR